MTDKHDNSKSCLIYNARLVTPFEIISPGWILTEDGKISQIGRDAKPQKDIFEKEHIKKIDAQGHCATPGLIDTHVCGMLGCDCREGEKAYITIAKGLPKFGITSFLPTIIATPISEVVNLAPQAKKLQNADSSTANILGLHLEGPYLGKKYRGLTLEEELEKPSVSRDAAFYESVPGFVKIMTLAPELPDCLPYISYLKDNGIVVSIGHTEIKSLSELNTAIAVGASHVTHIFNAMHVRSLIELGVDAPGFADLAIIEDALTVSLIADGVHVCPELINLLMRAKPHDKIVLITDCFMATAMPPGLYTYPDGVEIVVDDKCHRTVEGKLLAGSLLTLNRAVKNVIDWTPLPVTEVLPMATTNPAKLIGYDNSKGQLKPGMDADIVIFDNDWNVKTTIINGKVVYQA